MVAALQDIEVSVIEGIYFIFWDKPKYFHPKINLLTVINFMK
jgi:hypothetical protein